MKIPKKSKTYVVKFHGDYEGSFKTTSIDKRNALNNACHQMARHYNVPVAIIRWKVNEGHINYEIEEAEKEVWL